MLEFYKRSMYVSPRSLLIRNFTMIDMMRKLDLNDTPDDLVYLYLHDTSCHSWDPANFFRRYYICENECTQLYDLERVDKASAIRNRAGIPTALRKMANDYLRRCFWSHIQSCWEYYTVNSRSCVMSARRYPHVAVKRYPVYVRNALDQVMISDYAELEHVQAQLDAFSAVVNQLHYSHNSTTTTGKPISVEPTDFTWSDSTWTTLSCQQEGNLSRIIRCIGRFIYRMTDTARPIPVVLQDTFFNVLTSILLLKYNSFLDARQDLTICAFSKLNPVEIGKTVRIGNPEYIRHHCDKDRWGWLWDGTADKANEILCHLTPQAACCIGRFISFSRLSRNDLCMAVHDVEADSSTEPIFVKIIKQLNPEPIAEVRRYMVSELSVERNKLECYLRNQPSASPSKTDCDPEASDTYETCRLTLDDLERASKLSEYSIIAHPERLGGDPEAEVAAPMPVGLL